MSKKENAFLISVYFVSFSLIIGTIIFVFKGLNKFDNINDKNLEVVVEEVENDDNIKQVINENDDITVPVINDNVTTVVIRPYVSDKVTIGKYFYNYEGSSEDQEKSLVYYENTYMQNSGVDYVSNEKFDVVSILNGEVVSVKNDDLLGNVIQVRHENNILSVYEAIDEVKVKEGDTVAQGFILGTSGKSKINSEYENVLHFEIYHNGEAIDPENFYSINIEN